MVDLATAPLPDRWVIALNGEPISPEFSTWDEAAQWAVAHGHGKLVPFDMVGSKRVWLVREEGVETWNGHQIAEYELREIL